LVGLFFAGEDAGDYGEDVMEIDAVGNAQRGWRQREVEDEEMAAGSQDAGHFAQGAGPGFHVAQAEGDGDGVEGGIGEGEMEGVGEDGIAEAFCAGAVEHGLAEIGTGDLRGRGGALDGQGEVAAAGGQIKKGGGMPLRDDGGGAGAPEEVEAAGEEMIGEIVSSRDGREEIVDEFGLLLLQMRAIYLRGQMMRIKKMRPAAVRMDKATRKL